MKNADPNVTHENRSFCTYLLIPHVLCSPTLATAFAVLCLVVVTDHGQGTIFGLFHKTEWLPAVHLSISSANV